MKLTIGEKWHWDHDGFTEELTVIGLESIDKIMEDGVEVVPEGPTSGIKVTVTNDFLESKKIKTLKLSHLTGNWTRGELQ